MDQQAQQREVHLVRTVTIPLETQRPQLGAWTRRSIRQTKSLADLIVLASGDAVVSLDHTD